MNIIKWCGLYADFLMVILGIASLVTTIVYVVATVFILRANKKSANMAEKQIIQANESMRKMIDLQLYDKRLEIAKKFEHNDYSNSIMEIGVLFNNDILARVKNLKQFLKEKEDWEAKYNSYIKTRDEQGLFDYNLEESIQSDDVSEELKIKYKEMIEKCKIVYLNACDPEGNQYFYDYDEICENKSEIEEIVNKKEKELKNMVYQIMKETIAVNIENKYYY